MIDLAAAQLLTHVATHLVTTATTSCQGGVCAPTGSGSDNTALGVGSGTITAVIGITSIAVTLLIAIIGSLFRFNSKLNGRLSTIEQTLRDASGLSGRFDHLESDVRRDEQRLAVLEARGDNTGSVDRISAMIQDCLQRLAVLEARMNMYHPIQTYVPPPGAVPRREWGGSASEVEGVPYVPSRPFDIPHDGKDDSVAH